MENRSGLPPLGPGRDGGGSDKAAGRVVVSSDGSAGGPGGGKRSGGPILLAAHPAGDMPPKGRRRRPFLRVFFVLVVIVEALVLLAVHEFSPVHSFEITSVTVTSEDGVTTVVGDNPDLLYPIKLGGTACRVSDMARCVSTDALPSTLASVCCLELLNSNSSGPEELISSLATFSYVVAIPALILLVRGFLLGRLWALNAESDAPLSCSRKGSKTAWGKRRWHLRVEFFALDAFVGLFAAVVTALLFSVVAQVTVGRPRPNYLALRFYTEHAFNGQNFEDWLVTSWPSGDAAMAMSGMLFLAYVLWKDLAALVMWRRRAHPGFSLALAILGGLALGVLPMSAILIGVMRIQEYWHRTDDVLMGFVIGAAAAHWSFQLVVLMPFSFEIGSPEWRQDPKWLDDEERQWQEEEEEQEVLRLCWRKQEEGRDSGAPPLRVDAYPPSDVEKG